MFPLIRFYCSDMECIFLIYWMALLQLNISKIIKEPKVPCFSRCRQFFISSSWNDQPWNVASSKWSFQLMAVSWSCVPALTWVWFIIQSKPWVGQRPGEMEGTSTTGAFLSLVTVKRKGDMSKHFSSPRFQHHQRCTASLSHHTARPPHTGKDPGDTSADEQAIPVSDDTRTGLFNTDLCALHGHALLFYTLESARVGPICFLMEQKRFLLITCREKESNLQWNAALFAPF